MRTGWRLCEGFRLQGQAESTAGWVAAAQNAEASKICKYPYESLGFGIVGIPQNPREPYPNHSGVYVRSLQAAEL